MIIKKKKISLLDEDLLADMYDFIRKDLYEHGYKQYEISNYSKNKESIHNKIYWQNLEYIGVGAGASGYIEKIRYENNSILDKYFNEFISTKDEITEEISKSEFMILGLRMIDGVSKKEYFSRYQSNINEDFDLDYILNNGLIIETDDIIKLSEKGIPLANIVFERFV